MDIDNSLALGSLDDLIAGWTSRHGNIIVALHSGRTAALAASMEMFFFLESFGSHAVFFGHTVLHYLDSFSDNEVHSCSGGLPFAFWLLELIFYDFFDASFLDVGCESVAEQAGS